MIALLRIGVALVSGLVFGLGLAISGMMDPSRVRAFLDVAGDWDPSLAFVLGSAVTVSAIGTAIMRRWPHPVLDRSFHLPTKTRIDRPLVVGSAIFGVGWGLAGLCPGPAVASLVLGFQSTAVFVVTMIAGMVIRDRWSTRAEGSVSSPARTAS
ncbi:YeeE/YedE family protein [Mycobacterium sp. KBS0706]|uniref:YeeE/YedE family protein n=1 Tax=Mycobacterium sp. KBS0706 TaxID=2578109 RepID=UPI00110FA843|nr:YeeE/YedE family protein [Mycobacterium sp. KBS0706]TSD84635.1 YeeE/YedE family protein [Mycobacterium sp. KBS0706]